jgi:hypothetical protein
MKIVGPHQQQPFNSSEIIHAIDHRTLCTANRTRIVLQGPLFADLADEIDFPASFRPFFSDGFIPDLWRFFLSHPPNRKVPAAITAALRSLQQQPQRPQQPQRLSQRPQPQSPPERRRRSSEGSGRKTPQVAVKTTTLAKKQGPRRMQQVRELVTKSNLKEKQDILADINIAPYDPEKDGVDLDNVHTGLTPTKKKGEQLKIDASRFEFSPSYKEGCRDLMRVPTAKQMKDHASFIAGLCAITRAGGRRKGEKEGNVAKKSKVRDLVDEIEEVKKKMEIDLRRAKRRQIIENTAENEEEWDALENDQEDSDNFIE